MANPESHNGYHPPVHELGSRTPEIASDGKFSVEFLHALPQNGDHKGIIVNAPGFGANWRDPQVWQMQSAIAAKDHEPFDWFEAQWGNRIAPFGKDASRENDRALRCYEIIMEEVATHAAKRGEETGKKMPVRGSGWSRGAAIAGAGAGRNPDQIDSLILVCPGFMEDTGQTAAKRYLYERFEDFQKGIGEHGLEYTRDVLPFFQHSLQNLHRTIHRGGASAGWSPTAEMFAYSLSGKPSAVIQGKYDKTFPPEKVRQTIINDFEFYLTVMTDELGITLADKKAELDALLPVFYEYPTAHGLGHPEQAAEILDFVIAETDERIAA